MIIAPKAHYIFNFNCNLKTQNSNFMWRLKGTYNCPKTRIPEIITLDSWSDLSDDKNSGNYILTFLIIILYVHFKHHRL